MTVLLVTYNHLNITEFDARNIIGSVYKDTRAVVDAVDALAGGKKMEEGVIYHFNGMGISAMISPPDIISGVRESPSGHLELDRGVTAVKIAEAVTNSPLETLAAHPFVSCVCQTDATASMARQETGRADADPPDVEDWNLNAIHVNGDTACKYTGKDIKIALLDTGIAAHKDLKVIGGASFCVGQTDFRQDSDGHGTNCAGIVAGKRGGIAKNAKLFSVRISETTGPEPVPLLAGLGWALRNRMNVVSISLAGPPDLKHIPAFANAVQALMRIDCVVVASTGDCSTDVGFPANTPGVIAVGGCGKNHVILNDTNMGGNGNPMTVVAPAQHIRTTYPERDGYISFGGSSAATPHVAGLVALIHERFPGITALQVIGRIQATAQEVKIRQDKEVVVFGDMLIDCDAALSLY